MLNKKNKKIGGGANLLREKERESGVVCACNRIPCSISFHTLASQYVNNDIYGDTGLTGRLGPRFPGNYPCQLLLLWRESLGLCEANRLNEEVETGAVFFIAANLFMTALLIYSLLLKRLRALFLYNVQL